MKKLLLILAALSVSMGATAVQTGKAGAKPPHRAASAPAPSASAPAAKEAHAAAWASKQRSAKMAACRKDATDRGLREVELKTAIIACANP